MKTARKFLNTILDIVFPPVCINCKCAINDQSDVLCEHCTSLLYLHTDFLCPQCHRPCATATPCHDTPFILAPTSFYHDPIPALIRHYKHNKLSRPKTFCATLCALHLKQLPLSLDSYHFTYIPLHNSRQRTRGFNQAREIAEMVGNHFNRPVIDTLTTTRAHKPQSQYNSHKKRARNVAGAFCIQKPNKVEGKNLILVDDICDSGATLFEAAKTLKKAGVKHIVGLVVAKT